MSRSPRTLLALGLCAVATAALWHSLQGQPLASGAQQLTTAIIGQPQFHPAFAQQTQQEQAPDTAVSVEVLRQDFSALWGLAFLPNGELLLTEKSGHLWLLNLQSGQKRELTGLPAVAQIGQGGLLDVAVDVDFARQPWIYWTFAEAAADGRNSTAAGRARLDVAHATLHDIQVIYRQTPKVHSAVHFGARIVPATDGTLWITQGDRGDHAEDAQRLDSGVGKIVRITRDGGIPADNPWAKPHSTALPAIWSYGHRNVQGAALDAAGRLWSIEHGAQGGDELNRPEAGKNYGWPHITYGLNYDNSVISQKTQAAGLEQPVYYWNPVIAPCGMTFYHGSAFPHWQGNLLIAGLKSQALVRLILNKDRVQAEQRYLTDLGERLRDVQVGADGLIYVVTDSGKLLRVHPAKLK